MASVSEAVFFDTTVLVSGLIDFGPSSAAAIPIFDALAKGAISNGITARHCCLEFYSVSTRLPEEYRLEPAEARQLLDCEVFARLRVCDLEERQWRSLFVSATAEGIAGGRIYDAYIGEVARQAGARLLVTDNRLHFTALLRYETRVLTSAEFTAECGLG